MQDTIVRLTQADRDELLAFLDTAFTTQPTAFERLLPGIYPADDASMACNFALRRHGDLAAVVGLFPISLQAGSHTLRIAGIGGVSTASQYRGQGLMRRLMDEVMRTIRHEGYHASFLGGQRQRYGYWGYERCGASLQIHLSPPAVRHGLSGLPEVSLHPLRPEPDHITPAIALYEAQPLHTHRPHHRFHAFLRHWNKEPWLVRDRTGAIRGYLAGDANAGDLTELVADTPDTALHALRAWAGHCPGKPINLSLHALPNELARRLVAAAETTHLQASGNWQIFDWPRVLTALMALRHQIEPLADGQATIAIRDHTLHLMVDGPTATAANTDLEPDLRTDPFAAHLLLFGPTPPDFGCRLPPATAALHQWCPLPLALPAPDHV